LRFGFLAANGSAAKHLQALARASRIASLSPVTILDAEAHWSDFYRFIRPSICFGLDAIEPALQTIDGLLDRF
jgi:hypothetical protein